MKIRIFNLIILVFLISCKKKEVEGNKFYEELSMQRKEMLLENIGKKYYEKNCVSCHAGKDAKDNFLVNSVRNQKRNESFFIDFITKQDSLLKYENKEALALKDWSNENAYIHNFDFNDNEIKAILYYLKK
ncbi:Cytochrome c [Flavobacterium resistens]|uniref:C-type cytochrome n=1 Tax=Flavobacterium resistens TaxID=443612 RepID=A0A521F8K9_9FLAO|nr:c-type cytochrome [Flavobacterium resistens]MRX70143.1 c-type cytochrome [Flavobacterium resistens]SMO91830.1 Cytochrome c [Flavobacterium resistens]